MAGVFVRGLTGNKVNVFVDGVRYSNSAQRGGVNTFFDLVEPSSLEGSRFCADPTARSTAVMRSAAASSLGACRRSVPTGRASAASLPFTAPPGTNPVEATPLSRSRGGSSGSLATSPGRASAS